MSATTRCPNCDTRGVPILYGFPTEEAMVAADAGQLVLGGCLVSDDDPVLACRSCGARWGRRPQRQEPAAP